MATNIDLFGWQTVFAVNYPAVNQAIKENASTPKDFEYTDDDAQLAISGTWKDWQLTRNSDGPNLHLYCPVGTGTAKSGTQGSVDLSGGSVTIQLRLDAVPNPNSPVTDPTGTAGTPTELRVRTEETDLHRPVTVVTSDFPNAGGLVAEALPGLFQAWFTRELKQFNNLFATVVLNSTADKDDYQWLKPTLTSYACVNAEDGTADNSVFAVLCCTEYPPPPGRQQQVDARLLSNRPAGVNSAFAIDTREFLQNVLIKSAVLCIQGSNESQFDITNDNSWIVNNQTLHWGSFRLANGDVVTPSIGIGDFQLGFQGGRFDLRITDATFDWPAWHQPGHLVVQASMRQSLTPVLKKSGKGWVLVPDEQTTTKEFSANMSPDRTAMTYELALSVGIDLLGVVLGSFLGPVFESAATTTVTSTSQAAVRIGEEAIEQTVQNIEEQTVENVDREAGNEAGDAVRNQASPTYLQNWGAALQANKWKLFGGLLGGIVGSQAGLIPTYIELAAEGKIDQLPTIEEFAANCVGATAWPLLPNWEPRSVQLPGAFVLTGALS